MLRRIQTVLFTAAFLLAGGLLTANTHAQPADEITTLFDRMWSHYEKGNYRAALPLAKRLVPMIEASRGRNHHDTATILLNLGTLHQNVGELEDAVKRFQESLQICLRIYGPNHLQTTQRLSAIGTLLMHQGEYVAARAYLEQSLKVCRATLGEEHADTIGNYNTLGMLLVQQGDLDGGQSFCRRSLDLSRKALGEEHEYTLIALQNLGTIHGRRKEFAKAREYLEQSLRIHRKLLGDDHPKTITVRSNLAYLIHQSGDSAAARPLIEQVVAAQRRTVGVNHMDTATYLAGLAETAFTLRDDAAARGHWEESLAIRIKLHGEEHPKAVESLHYLAGVAAAAGDWSDAVAKVDRSQRLLRRHIARVLPGLSDREQQSFLTGLEERTGVNFSLALLRRDDPAAVAASAGWVLNAKGVGHEAAVVRTLATRNLGNAEASQIGRQLVDVRRQLASATSSASTPEQSQARASLAAQEEELTRKLILLGQSQALAGDWVELDAVREQLAADEVLIEFASFTTYDVPDRNPISIARRAHYAAWIIPAKGKDPIQLIDLGPADAIEQAVDTVRQKIALASRPDGVLVQRGEQEAEQELAAPFQKVADLVWKPVVDKIGAPAKLVISPDANLWLLPWAALPVGEGQSLIERYSLTVVNSGRDLITRRVDLKVTPPVLFANPDFDLRTADVSGGLRAMFPGKTVSPETVPSNHGLPRVTALAGTAAEIDAITPSVQKLTSQKPQVYAGRWAMETVVREVHRPQFLVLSTHGFFLPEQPNSDVRNPLLRCGLLFSGCNTRQSTAGDDGVLTGLEICGIDLRGTELVVLSACETGVGQIRTGEGVAGLRQAFQLAGAQAVVATLWQIPDAESARLMNDFFLNLAAGQSRAEALRNAQLKRIAARRDKYGAAHPYFWAAYTLTGR